MHTVAIRPGVALIGLTSSLRLRAALSHLAAFTSRPAVAYPLLALLQLKILWGDWYERDLKTGDNLVYVVNALRWLETGTVDLVWSPLYSVYYALVIRAVGDVADASWVQRFALTFAAALLVLAVLRAVLPPGVAWIIAAWWATLESVFDVLVEVHLFAILPLLLAAVLVAQAPNRWGRSVALGVLLTAGALIRNEYAVTAILFGTWCLWIETRVGWRLWAPRLAPYALAVLAVAGVVLWFDARATVPLAKLAQPYSDLSWKHTANLCQAYAASYVQRHDDWSGDVFLGCNALMERDFGLASPTLHISPTFSEAARANPLAMTEHMLWNLGLAGNGLQVALFGAMSGTMSPEFSFVKVKQDRETVPILSALLLALLIVGGILAVIECRHALGGVGTVSERPGCSGKTLPGPLAAWAVILAGALMTGLVIAAVRPRPEYIYPLVLLVLALAGGSVALILKRCPAQLAAALVILGMAGAFWLAPRFYDDAAHRRPRLATWRYETLRPYAALIRDPQTVFLMGPHAAGLTAFYGRQLADLGTVYRHEAILGAYTGQEPLERLLNEKKINLFFLDRFVLAKLGQYKRAERLIHDPESVGWRLIGMGTEGTGPWMLLQREGQ